MDLAREDTAKRIGRRFYLWIESIAPYNISHIRLLDISQRVTFGEKPNRNTNRESLIPWQLNVNGPTTSEYGSTSRWKTAYRT